MEALKKIFGGLIFIAFSITIILLIPSQIVVTNTESINSRTFPYMISYVVMFLSFTQVFVGIYYMVSNKEYNSIKKCFKNFEIRFLFRFFIIFTLLVLYCYVVDFIGFLFSSLIFIYLYIFMISGFSVKRILISSFFVLFSYYVFNSVLLVQFPKGDLI